MRVVCALLAIVAVAGCIGQAPAAAPQAEDVVAACAAACRAALDAGQDLAAGPCLLDPIPGTDWVCDVAHSPRTDVDDVRANQCDAWWNRTATRFVEVTPDCELIQAR